MMRLALFVGGLALLVLTAIAALEWARADERRKVALRAAETRLESIDTRERLQSDVETIGDDDLRHELNRVLGPQ